MKTLTFHFEKTIILRCEFFGFMTVLPLSKFIVYRVSQNPWPKLASPIVFRRYMYVSHACPRFINTTYELLTALQIRTHCPRGLCLHMHTCIHTAGSRSYTLTWLWNKCIRVLPHTLVLLLTCARLGGLVSPRGLLTGNFIPSLKIGVIKTRSSAARFTRFATGS